MRKLIVAVVALGGVGLWIGGTRLAAEEKQPAGGGKPGEKMPGAGGHPEMGPVPIGPEHARFKDLAGTWKVEHKMWHDPNSAPVVSTGTEVAMLILDGRAIVSHVDGTCPEGPFQGYGITTWNVSKRKYQGCWLDTSSRNGLDSAWGDYDESAKTWNWQMEMLGPAGERMAMRGVEKMPDKDHKSGEYYMTGPDGKEFKMMELNGTRTK